MQRFAVAIALACALALPVDSQSRQGLRIVVLAGEDAVNVIQQKTAVAPLVEVRDRNNQPVAGAIVTFSIEGGRNAVFAAGANTVTVTTNALGQAAVTGFTPTAAGAVQINVAATFQAQTAAAAITQTNFATAAQAAASASSASTSSAASTGAGGGGGIGAGTITAIGASAAAAAGGWYAYERYQQGDPPTVESVTVFPPSGFAGVTPMLVSFAGEWHSNDADTGASLTVDYGDGTMASWPMPDPNSLMRTHVYQSEGTFTARVTFKDAWDRTATGQAIVVIKSMTGRWSLGTTGTFLVLTQSGSALMGTMTASGGQVLGTVTGSIGPQATNNVSLVVTPSGSQGVAGAYTGTTSRTSADQVSGTFTVGASVGTQIMQRQ